jgi:predicted GIY-YIG superfamily endonuclease
MAQSYGGQASLRMHYVYLLKSEPYPKQQYVGLTRDLRKRLRDHNHGHSPHTSKFCPWILVAYFAFAHEKNAIAFERYLKSGSGRAFIKRHFL